MSLDLGTLALYPRRRAVALVSWYAALLRFRARAQPPHPSYDDRARAQPRTQVMMIEPVLNPRTQVMMIEPMLNPRKQVIMIEQLFATRLEASRVIALQGLQLV